MKHPYYINQDINQFDQFGNKVCNYNKKKAIEEMNTNELKDKIKDLENKVLEMTENHSVFYTNILNIAIKENYFKIVEYINPEPQDLINAKDSNQEIINEPIKKPKIPDKPVIIALTENTLKNTLLKWIDLK